MSEIVVGAMLLGTRIGERESFALLDRFTERGGRRGASNHPAWRVERGRGLAAAQGVAGWTALQLRHSYLRPRPGAALPASAHRVVTDEVLDFVLSNDDASWTRLSATAWTRRPDPLSGPVREAEPP